MTGKQVFEPRGVAKEAVESACFFTTEAEYLGAGVSLKLDL
jgi:hypothetical protein